MTRIALVGAAARLPMSPDLGTLWDNLVSGRDCITRPTVEELRGIERDRLLDDARWIGASGRIDRAHEFDPAYFGMAPRTATVTDPQHRLLLTTVQHALDDAAIVPERGARVGVYVGVGRNRHEELVRTVSRLREDPIDEMTIEVGNGKDHASTKVAFRYGFTGPAVTVQSACSTGLVAVHQACQALANHECDIAIAGAAAVRVPGVHGYLYLPGSIGSSDGFCRPFSARASGAVAGDGVAVVVLMRESDALADEARVRAVVLGSAVNNDGAKSGYASVSAAAQEDVIRDALLFAEVEPDDVGSVEAHGSGTPLGDATEWSALRAVYGGRGRTLVGSVKSNLGHLREVSGLAGLLRVVGSLEHGRVPPTINVGAAADFTRDDSGLVLARSAQDWPLPGVRRAAVSAFGLGGTNAHVVLEEAPEVVRPAPAGDDRPSLVVLSAHTPAALDATAAGWAAALRDGVPLASAAAVSQRGRARRAHRRFVVGTDREEVAEDLADGSSVDVPDRDGLCFVFPGVGDQYPSMAAGLREWLPGFDGDLRGLLEACGEHAGRDLSGALSQEVRGTEPTEGGFSLRRLVEKRDGANLEEVDTIVDHAVVFSLQVALARSLQRLGLQFSALVGHSLGELSAATVAGTFADDEAARFVMTRARLVDAQPAGAMLALNMSEQEATALTGPDVWLAAVNSPRSCVVAGERDVVVALAETVADRGMAGRLLPVSQALHTPLMGPAADELTALLGTMTIRPPRVPVASNVTGGWVGDEITDLDYWRRHLTGTVRFGQALVTASSRSGVLLEIGPGQLRTLATQCQRELGGVAVVSTVRREYQNERDDAVLLRAIGATWAAGAGEPDWGLLGAPTAGWRASLPGTAFDERRHDVAEGIDVDLDAAGPVVHAATAPRPAGGEAAASAPAPGPEAERETTSDVLRALEAVWAQVLGVTELRGSSDFFELGGDSMMSVQLIRGLEERLGFHVPAFVVFEESQLRRMARRIESWNEEREQRDG